MSCIEDKVSPFSWLLLKEAKNKSEINLGSLKTIFFFFSALKFDGCLKFQEELVHAYNISQYL